MIVTSIHDPALFDHERLTNNRRDLNDLCERLDHALRCHLFVRDGRHQNSLMWSQVTAAFPHLPARIQERLSAIPLERILHLPRTEDARRDSVLDLVGGAGTAEAVCLVDRAGVDVMLAADDTVTALELNELPTDKVATLESYSETEAYARELLSTGGRPISDLTKVQVCDEILRPFLYWAKSVCLIDKMLSIAAFGAKTHNNPTAQPTPNWQRFRETVRLIYSTWDQGPNAPAGVFEIVTTHTTNFVRNGQPVLGPDLAAEFAQRLGISRDRLKISLKSEVDVRPISHDRYLRTNHGLTLGITKGFDVLDNTQQCGAADVYLRQPQANDIIDQLIRKRNQGESLPRHPPQP
jgi:hypothetical protein